MQIEFEIDGMRLTRTSDAYVTEGSKNFVQLLFTFSDDWDGIDKYALFARDNKTYEVAIVDGKCIVPYECARTSGQFQLTVVGKETAGDVIATTSDKAVRVSSNEFEENPTGSETRLTNTFLVDTLASAKDYADKAKEYADKAASVEIKMDKAVESAQNAAISEKAAKGYADKAKEYSESVNVFIPSVDDDGVMTWTNKAGLANPAPVNVKGERGEKGIQGPQGIQGATGAAGTAATIKIGTVTTGAAGTSAKVVNSGTTSAAVLDFTIPQGAKGDKGNTGTAATIEVGTVTTGAAGSSASVTNSGTASNVVLNFTLPRGKDGKDSNVTVDTALSATSTNPVQNKVIKAALDGKLGKNAAAASANKLNTNGGSATQPIYFANGVPVATTYTLGKSVPSDAKFTDTVYNHPTTHPASMITGLSTVATSGSYSDLSNKPTIPVVPTKVSAFINDAGYLTQHQSLDGYAKTSVANTWTAQQNFHDLMFNRERYTTYGVNGTSYKPTTSTIFFTATGAFTLNLATLAGALSSGQSSVFTAYFAANADYTLTITNAGTIKYIGNASDVAITSAGLLLNILMLKDGDNVTSIVQASKLS